MDIPVQGRKNQHYNGSRRKKKQTRILLVGKKYIYRTPSFRHSRDTAGIIVGMYVKTGMMGESRDPMVIKPISVRRSRK